MESPGQQKSWRTIEDTEENGEGGEREANRLETNRVRYKAFAEGRSFPRAVNGYAIFLLFRLEQYTTCYCIMVRDRT